MPTNYLKKIQKETGIPLAELEEKWERAKKEAHKGRYDNEFAVATAIFKNMVGLANDFESYSKKKKKPQIKPSKWWKSLTSEQKKKYIEKYPNSKYAKLVKMARTTRKMEANKVVEKINSLIEDPKQLPMLLPALISPVEQQAKENLPFPVPIEDTPSQEIEKSIIKGENPDEEIIEGEFAEIKDELEDKTPVFSDEAKDELKKHEKEIGSNIKNSLKKKLDESHAGAFYRFVKGDSQEGDKEKVAKVAMTAGAALLGGALALGIGATIGVGPVVQFTQSYLEQVGDRLRDFKFEPSPDSVSETLGRDYSEWASRK